MSSPATSRPGFDHVLDRNALRAQIFLQRKALAGRIADAELQLHGRRNRAVAEIAARLGAVARGQRVGEEFRRQFHHVVQRLAALLVPRGIGGYGGQREARHRRQPLDGFGKRDALGLHQERDDVAMLAGRKIVVKSLLVVDGERRRFFLLERRQPLPLPPRLLQLHAPADDFRNRKPGAQFIEELGRKAHGAISVVSRGAGANRLGI